jgi:hypothetical protein
VSNSNKFRRGLQGKKQYGTVEDEIRELWRRKLRNITVAYIYLFPDFMCQSIANAQRIKSLVRITRILFRVSLKYLEYRSTAPGKILEVDFQK